MKYRDYYKILGVERGASDKEIRDAFRALARKYHPDRHPSGSQEQKDAEKRFKEITEAHEVLGDAEKRKKYDTLGAGFADGSDWTPPEGFDFGSVFGGGRRGGAGGGGPGGFSDFFRTIFGAAGGRGAPFGFGGEDPFSAARGGADAEGTLDLDVLEAFRGGKRHLSLAAPHGGTRTVELNVPAGVREGARLRLRGQGSPGVGGGPAGDLLLRIRLRNDGPFELRGDDVHTEVKVWPWEVVQGAQIDVPTLEGTARLRIPDGSRGDGKLRLRGQGWIRGDGSRGDLFVALRVVLPAQLTEAERELYEKLAALRRGRP